MLKRLKDIAERQRGKASRIKFGLESILAVAGIAALAAAAWHHFTLSEPDLAAGEGKRVVAFRQVANRICTENRANMKVALREARTRVERLAFVARTLGWDLNDLESITAPPTKFDGFLDEIAVRRRLRDDVLTLQQAIELGQREEEAAAIGEIEERRAESREISRQIGVIRCVSAVPEARALVRPTTPTGRG